MIIFIPCDISLYWILFCIQAHSGGSVVISSGDGKSSGQYKSGGKGGDFYLSAGLGEGHGDDGDGGSIAITAGNALHSNGGHVAIASGSSEQTTSGSVGKAHHYDQSHVLMWRFYSHVP